MDLQDRISAFVSLGNHILGAQTNKIANDFWQTISQAHFINPWFTQDFCKQAMKSIAKNWLNRSNLDAWISKYPPSQLKHDKPKTIAVIMAGNVPFVGFHDMLCVLITGNKFLGKISSKDGGLMQALIDMLYSIEPRFTSYISIADGKLTDFDAVIATGSDNSARYFEYYFGKYPNIIRKNRHSVAILTGYETEEELLKLTDDIFSYFGLGCRSVSKLLVPMNYNFEPLFEKMEKYKEFANHNKYANNYQYYRAIFLMNQIYHLDNGFALLKPDESLGSPVGVVYYQHYASISDAVDYVNNNSNHLQCVVTRISGIANVVNFGESQSPLVSDYADGIDTMDFLFNI